MPLIPCRARRRSSPRQQTSAIDFYFAIQEVGIAQGIFAKHGIEIETITLDGSAKQHQAMTAGSADIALGAGPDMVSSPKARPRKRSR